ncbi:MAG: ABC transporter permease [Acidothermaceae bacterium]
MPKHLLAGHPPWRQLLIVSLALPAVVIAAVLTFAWPTARIQPRDLPIGIVGSTPGSQRLIDHLTAVEPGGFAFHLYADDAAARAAITNRSVYGAFLVTSGRVEVLTASAASPAVAQLLTNIGVDLVSAATQQAAAHDQPPIQLTARDVVPVSARDPKGLVFSSSLLPLTICSIIVAAAIGVLVRFRPAWRQILALTVVSAVTAAGAYLISQTFLGALPNEGAADWASIALTMLAMSAATTGFIALVGVGGLAIAAALMVFVGNPFSGATSAPELLPTTVNHVGQWLPPGAGANLLRSTAYFHGNGAAGHLCVLLAWIVLGFATIVLGHHASIRFAAHPDRQAKQNPRVS